jgi:hypothetical protein
VKIGANIVVIFIISNYFYINLERVKSRLVAIVSQGKGQWMGTKIDGLTK